MAGNASDLHAALKEAEKTQVNLDRKIFYLRMAFETSRELNGLIQPGKIMDTFLLMAMGPLGITQGIAALVNTIARDGHITLRGFPEADAETLRGNIPQICDRYFADRNPITYPTLRAQVLTDQDTADQSLFPAQTNVLILWNISEEYSGLLGFGEKISGQPLSEDDIDTLLNLTNTLISALSHALSTKNIQQLNADLQKKNTELQEALNQAGQTRQDLDRRVFHLKTLYDLSTELSPMIRTEELLETFLLMTMGTFGIGEGLILLYDRETKTARTAQRGGQQGVNLDAEAAEKLLYQCFEVSESRSLTPMSVTGIDTSSLRLAQSGIPIEARSGLMFVADQTMMGMMVFGETLAGAPLSEEEKELLFTQVVNFMVFLKNAGYFETIQALNEDLRRRNEDLRRTIAELTEARYKITLLEKAGAQIRSLIRREMERAGRVSPWDPVLIVLVSTLVGLLFNFSNPNGVPLLPLSLLKPSPPLVDVVEAKKRLDEGAVVLVDARPMEFYNQKRIKGAVNVPPALFDIIYMMKLSHLDLDKEIIVYGRNISKRYDAEVAYYLSQRDHENIKLLSGGLSAWEMQGYPIEP